MNKKLSLKAIFASLLSVVFLASCTKTPEELIIKEYNNINRNVETVSQEILVLDRTYNVAEGTKTVTSKTLNTIDATDPYKVTTNTSNASISEIMFELSLESFATYALDDKGDLAATVSNDSVNSVLGIDATKVNGDVSILFDVYSVEEAIKLEAVIISYKSSNGNDVKITTSYVYKK